MRIAVVAGAFLWLSLTMPLPAQDLRDFADDPLEHVDTWEELCEVVDCDQIPMGHDTFLLGPELYYFPHANIRRTRITALTDSRVSSGRFFDGPAWNQPSLRTFSNRGSFRISLCCDTLLRYYGLADDMPPLTAAPDPFRLRGVRLRVTRYDEESFLWFGEYLTFDEVAEELYLSYNDDFWILSVVEPDPGASSDRRGFNLLSKRPLLNGRHVRIGCFRLCAIRTRPFAGDEDETRANLHLQWVLFTRESMFLCSLEDVERGCDPSPDWFDDVPQMLAVMEQMFEAAQVFPEEQSP